MILEKFDNEAIKYERKVSENNSERDDVMDEQIDSSSIPQLKKIKSENHSKIVTELREINFQQIKLATSTRIIKVKDFKIEYLNQNSYTFPIAEIY
jgi:hypothetical protein